MKQKLIVFRLTIVSILLLTTIIYSASVTISKPTDNQTITIPSGTSISVLFEWYYVIDPGTTTWGFSTNTDGNWSDYSTDLSKTIDNVGVGTYTWKVRMQYYKSGSYYYVEDQVTFSVALGNYSIAADNIFGGGQIKVGINITATTRTAPYNFSANTNDVVYLEAIENQSSGGYSFIWNDTEAPSNKSDWRKKDNNNNDYFFSFSRSDNFTVTSDDDGYTYEAGLRKICNLTFTNSFSGISETFYIKVNGTTVSAPSAQYQVIEGNNIQVEANQNRTFNNVFYKFSHWNDNDTAKIKTISVSQHDNITAYYDAINPPSAPQNLSVTESNNEHPLLSWTANSEPEVNSYNIYRQKNSDGWNLIGSDTSTSYEDLGVTTTYRHGDDIYYKVTALNIHDKIPGDDDSYILESDYSSTVTIEARIEKQMIDEEIVEEAPKVYALNSNYPNPCNPTTQISYQIPNDGFVNLTVYNSLGQEVAVLVNRQQSVGRYSVQFNAANLSSGIYFYRIAAGEFNSVKKMLLIR